MTKHGCDLAQVTDFSAGKTKSKTHSSKKGAKPDRLVTTGPCAIAPAKDVTKKRPAQGKSLGGVVVEGTLLRKASRVKNPIVSKIRQQRQSIYVPAGYEFYAL